MKNVLIHYFSGTGNTAHAVKLIKEGLEKKNFRVKTLAIKKGAVMPAEKFDFHIFTFCVLGFSAPALVKHYIRRIKDGGGSKAAVFAVFAGHPMQAQAQVCRMLRRRNFDVFLTDGAAYPNNWIQASDLERPEDAVSIIKEGDKIAEKFVGSFVKGEKRFFPAGLFNLVWSWLVAVMFGIVGRRFMGKFFIADENCNQCGICVKACPSGTISIINRTPHWGANCENCNRCINICPANSIQVSTARLVLHFSINILLIILVIQSVIKILPLLTGYLGILPAIPAAAALAVILSIVLILVQLYIIDWFFFLLEQIPGIRKIFQFSYTRKFRRYKAPGFNPLKEI